MVYNRYPAVDENLKFPPEIITALSLEDKLKSTVMPMTTTQRNSLTGAALWDGRTILNTTLDRIQHYDVGTASWLSAADVSDVPALATTGTPAGLSGTAARGTATTSARSDHVHPTAVAQVYTPTLTNMTLGNGSRYGEYIQYGQLVMFMARFILGSTSAIAANPRFSMPTSLSVAYQMQAKMVDNGTSTLTAVAEPDASGVYVYGIGTNGAIYQVNATSPFTWVNGDSIEVRGMYRM